MSRTAPRRARPGRGPAVRRPAPRRSRAGVIVAVLVAAGLAVLAFGDDALWRRSATLDASRPAAAEPTAVTVDDILAGAVTNPDGTITVKLSEAETAGLVRAGLSRSGAPVLENLTIDLVRPDGSASGQMEIAGQLRDQPLPVNATVELEVANGRAEPSVRSVRVGPLQVTESTRAQLNAQLREVSLLGVEGVTVQSLHTTDSQLEITGRRA
jgi:hypothetical protein